MSQAKTNQSGPITGTTVVTIETGIFNEFDLAFDEGSATGTVDVSYRKVGAAEYTVPASASITLGSNAGYEIHGITAEAVRLTPNITGGPITYYLTTRNP